MSLLEKIKNIFTVQPPTQMVMGSFYQPMKLTKKMRSSVIRTIFSRLAIDVSMVDFDHIVITEEGERVDVDSGLDYCLNWEANLDQTHIDFFNDLVYSLFDEGVVAVVPVEYSTDVNYLKSYGSDVKSLRVGRIEEWFPDTVRVSLYDERKGLRSEVMVPKSRCAIIQNPFKEVVSGENSTLDMLLRRIEILEKESRAISSGQLDVILQPSYTLDDARRREMALRELNDLEYSLQKSKLGIGIASHTTKIHQLNRPAGSSVIQDIQFLLSQLYNQLGLTDKIFNGTANELELRFYYTHTVDVIVKTIVSEFERKFLTRTARDAGHRISYNRDMFKMVPVESLAQAMGVFLMNGVLSPNDVRPMLGFKISEDPEASKLFNRNINKQQPNVEDGEEEMYEEYEDEI